MSRLDPAALAAIVADAVEASPLSTDLDDYGVGERRHVEAAALAEGITPEAYLRRAAAQQTETPAARREADAVVARIRATR